MSSLRRPEHKAPPELYYDETEARKYTSNSRMIDIQMSMADRAIELLALPEDEPALLLDLGCGSGLSGECLEQYGYNWVGLDISTAMLSIAREREVEGDLIMRDLGDGIPFRAGAFDGAISISALQWLCNADKRNHVPSKRLNRLFSSLYACLSRGSRAVFQFYPENSQQIELITQQAMKAGFSGGLVVDYPNSNKAKKMFLVLMTGGVQPLPQGIESEEQSATAKFIAARDRAKKIRNKAPKKSKDWIQEKKERRRRQGRDVRADSKFTGRRRCGKF